MKENHLKKIICAVIFPHLNKNMDFLENLFFPSFGFYISYKDKNTFAKITTNKYYEKHWLAC